MSKGLEELERLAYENACCRCQYWGEKGCSLCYQNNECPCAWLEIWIELKAFKIIKEKKIDSRLFTDGDFDDYHDYLGRMCTWNCCNNNKELFEKCWGVLTEEEFDLLKEVLE